MKGKKNNQQGKKQELISWNFIPAEWDFKLSDWDFELPEWDFQLPESWIDFPDFNDNRKGAESPANKGKSKGKGKIYP